MSTTVIMPNLGLTMDEGTVARWLVVEGQQVDRGQPLLEVETDKVTMEVEALVSGIVGPLLVAEGQRVPVGTVLAHIDERGGDSAEAQAARKPTSPAQLESRRAAPVEPGIASPIAARPARQRTFSSPRARTRARMLEVDWRSVPGSGPRGRVVERDVLRAAERPESRSQAEVAEAFNLLGGLSPSSRVVRKTGIAAASLGGLPIVLAAQVRLQALWQMNAHLGLVVEKEVGAPLRIADWLVRIVSTALVRQLLASAMLGPVDQGAVQGQTGRIDLALALAMADGAVVCPLSGAFQASRMGLAQLVVERRQAEERTRQAFGKRDVSHGSFVLIYDLSGAPVEELVWGPLPRRSAIVALGQASQAMAPLEVRTAMLTLVCDSFLWPVETAVGLVEEMVRLIEEPLALLT